VTDFRQASHLPKRAGGKNADAYDLPRQRRGTTPQMHGRYPDYDVLEQASHWDEETRRVVLDRVDNVPKIRFFTATEADTLKRFCDLVTAQDAEPRIPVLSYIDGKLHDGQLDGYQYFDMPDDRDAWRLVARGLDEQARHWGYESFAAADLASAVKICERFAAGDLHGGAWDELNVSRAWSVVMRMILSAFYAHPWAWNEIGFGGPAYPRGYTRFGSPHLDKAERESWEGEEATAPDPVRETKELELE
jgi:gluconate 2-dehydrogenase subunit 3-like protein